MKALQERRTRGALQLPVLFLGAAALAFGSVLALAAWRRSATLAARLAETDPLTGGWSFGRFQAEAEKALEGSKAGEFAALVFDISHFKDYNDAYGYAEGDRLILALDKLLDSYDGPGEFHAREGGDRFVALLRWEGTDGFTRRFSQLDEDVNRLEVLEGRHCRILCRGGVAVFDGFDAGRRCVSQLLDRARYARECVRESPRSAFAVYTQNMKVRAAARGALQGAAVEALANGEFIPYYQPKVALATGEVVGFEALVRWRVSAEEVLVPADFLDPLESNGFVTEVDLVVFRQVCAFLRERIAAGSPVVPVACNFSRLNLCDDSFVSTILDVSSEFGVPCDLLELELTESIFMEDLTRAVAACRNLKSHGFRMAVDDFGSGYSSLGALQELPVDVLKIDRSLLVSSEGNANSMIILESVVRMADKLGMSVVVEGVETPGQAALLATLDSRIVAQGYLFSPPVPEEEAAALLDREKLLLPIYERKKTYESK